MAKLDPEEKPLPKKKSNERIEAHLRQYAAKRGFTEDNTHAFDRHMGRVYHTCTQVLSSSSTNYKIVMRRACKTLDKLLSHGRWLHKIEGYMDDTCVVCEKYTSDYPTENCFRCGMRFRFHYDCERELYHLFDRKLVPIQSSRPIYYCPLCRFNEEYCG